MPGSTLRTGVNAGPKTASRERGMNAPAKPRHLSVVHADGEQRHRAAPCGSACASRKPKTLAEPVAHDRRPALHTNVTPNS